MKRLFLLPLLCLALLLTSCEQRPKLAEINKLAPDFTLIDRKGKTWNLADLKGQVVFVNFWATWCSSCLREMPSMQNLYTSLPTETFKMLTILTNDEPAFADIMATKLKTTFPILDDPDSSTGKAYGLTGVPETYIIDKEGILREKFIGPVNWDSTNAKALVMKYISQ